MLTQELKGGTHVGETFTLKSFRLQKQTQGYSGCWFIVNEENANHDFFAPTGASVGT